MTETGREGISVIFVGTFQHVHRKKGAVMSDELKATRASDVKPMLNDSSYRRGFCHGVGAAIDALRAGATDGELCDYQMYLMNHWRYGPRRTEMVIPPTFWQWRSMKSRKE